MPWLIVYIELDPQKLYVKKVDGVILKKYIRYWLVSIKYWRQNLRLHYSSIVRAGVIIETRLAGGGSVTLEENAQLEHNVLVHAHGGNVFVGENSYIGANCVLYGHGGLTIGNNVMIAAGTIIIPANHNYQDKNKLIKTQGEVRLGINIKDDVWIGAGCIILDGVTIAKGSVIAAGSVVRTSTPEHSLSVGVPSRVLVNKSRA